MKNVLILEDKQEEVTALSKMLHKIDNEVEVYVASNIGDAYSYTIHSDISLFLVDIILDPQNPNDASGMEFVETIRSIPRYKFVPVIFITAVEDPTLHAYKDLHCYSYIKKPLHYADVEGVIKEALLFKHPVVDNDRFTIQQDKVLYCLKKSEIVRIDSHAGKMIFKTIAEDIRVFYRSCPKILEKLKSDKFVLCNRGTIINRDFIHWVDYSNNEIQLIEEYGTVKLRKSYKKEFIDEE